MDAYEFFVGVAFSLPVSGGGIFYHNGDFNLRGKQK
jgi:hypothetical protein